MEVEVEVPRSVVEGGSEPAPVLDGGKCEVPLLLLTTVVVSGRPEPRFTDTAVEPEEDVSEPSVPVEVSPEKLAYIHIFIGTWLVKIRLKRN